MASFEFISDENFRALLESDYHELVETLGIKAWKAVHVLAGSIIETLLADHLVVTDYYKRQKNKNPKASDKDIDPLQMSLSQLIEACKAEGILSHRSAQLSSVVQGYRNLIHPGRTIRLQERIDEEGATIAKSLVEMIVREAAEKRQETFGPTAAHIVQKLVQDPNSTEFIDHLLREMNQTELERLLLHELPSTYLHNLAFVRTFDSDQGGIQALKRGFRLAFQRASSEVQAKVARRFVTILREEAQGRIEDYEEAFFSVIRSTISLTE